MPRVMGGIEAKQKAKGESWQRNDRLIAVAVHAQTHENTKSMDDLRPHLVDEIKAFFIDYNRLRERKFKPLAESSPRKARKLIKAGWNRSGSRAGRVRDQIEIVQSYHVELLRAVASVADVAILTERYSIAARRRLSEPPRSTYRPANADAAA